jgi:hypothetical protein
MLTDTEKPTSADRFAAIITQAKTFPAINAAVVDAQEARLASAAIAVLMHDAWPERPSRTPNRFD